MAAIRVVAATMEAQAGRPVPVVLAGSLWSAIHPSGTQLGALASDKD